MAYIVMVYTPSRHSFEPGAARIAYISYGLHVMAYMVGAYVVMVCIVMAYMPSKTKMFS